MLLAIAIGSTNIRIAVFEGRQPLVQTSMRADTLILPDEYAVKIQSALQLFGCDPAEIDGVILSSVMPPLVSVMRQAVARLTGARMLVVGPGLKTGLHIRINDPGQLGSDLVVCAVAALGRYKPPLLVCSMGTATTMVAIDREGAVRGGAIMPGVKISLDALAEHTAQLPRIDLERPPRDVIGLNTVDCMKSGILYGTASAIEGMAARMEESLGEEAQLVATGSYAPAIAPLCRRPLVIDEDLMMEGLRMIYNKNSKGQTDK